MAVFEDVILEWEGEKKTVPANDVMRLLAKVEDCITLHEMQAFRERGTAPLVRVAMAYAAALRHAGFDVTDDGVYARLLSASAGDKGAMAIRVIQSLSSMMIPPADLDVAKAPAGKGKQGNPKAASNSSKPRTKQR